MTDPTAKGYTAPQCSCCGYTEEDAKMHMDHHLCRDAGNAPWEVKNDLKLTAKDAPAKEYEITGFRETNPAPESEDEAFRKWWIHAMKLGWTSIEYNAALAAWNARARLDAERGR